MPSSKTAKGLRNTRQQVRPAPARRISVVASARSKQRIDQAGKDGRLQGWRPTLDKPDMPRPADGIPQDIDQHMRLMCDILVLAFRTDTTRVCTLKLNNDHSSLRFPHLKVDYMIHHLLSHTDGADWLKVNQFFMRAGGLHRREARRGAGRRPHAARQLDDPVHVEHDDRQPQQRSTARS